MTALNYIPLIGAILAFLLGILIVSNRNQNKRARFVLALIVLFNVHSLLESYLFYNNLSWPGLGLSYLHYHLIGVLFLLYTHFLFRIDIQVRNWILGIVTITLLRIVFLSTINEDVLESATTFTADVIILSVDNILSILLNIWLLVLSFLKIRKIHFAVKLTAGEQVNYQWVKSLLAISIGLYLLILVSNMISLFDEEWLIYFKIESVINSIFSVALVYSSMRFPVFSVHGDFRDASATVKNKYINSSLTEDTSNEIWAEINQVMKEEKPYLNSEYRLNDLAERVGKSVHHVSQTINEKEGKSFSDFINEFRVEEAKYLLNSGRTKQVTILAVSLEAGFNSKTAFYNTFRKMTGLTPSDYLKQSDAQK